MASMPDSKLVQPLYEREPDSAAGPFYVVKDQCIICGLPPEKAPANISWSHQKIRRGCKDCPSHCRIERQPETREELTQVIEAARTSCVEAIRYCGTDPEILAQFRELAIARLCDALRKRPWWKFWRRG